MGLFSEIVNESQLLTELKKNREKDVVNAINNMLRVRISYNDEKGGKGKRERFIYPVAYGLTKRGNPAIRAFQTAGSTKRGVPKWKLFLFDRIFAWSNGKRSYKEYAENLKALGFNETGDLGMTEIFAIAPIAKGNVTVTNTKNTDISEPISKTDINKTSDLQNPNINKSNNFIPASQQRKIDIDNNQNDLYIGKNYNDNLTIDSPKTEPVIKGNAEQQNNQPQNIKNNIKNMSANDTTPVEKDDVINNNVSLPKQNNDSEDEFKKNVNDMMQRMNNLDKNNNSDGNI